MGAAKARRRAAEVRSGAVSARRRAGEVHSDTMMARRKVVEAPAISGIRRAAVEQGEGQAVAQVVPKACSQRAASSKAPSAHIAPVTDSCASKAQATAFSF